MKFHALNVATGLMGLSLIAVTACNAPEHEPWTANDLNSEKMDEAKARNEPHLRQMADNAMISDMSVADFHFIPHTDELSGTGAERLSRLAPYLDTYGGTVRYDTLLNDKPLVERRIAHVREFLETTGADMSRVEVTAMMSGGTVVSAAKAIQTDNKGTAVPASGGASPVVVGPALNP